MSSITSSSGAGDINSRYNRLASEYAKLRTQNNTLKQAVISDREQIAQLKESSEQTDRYCRKLENELESLSFRNEQLMKRMQQMLDDRDNELKRSEVKRSSFRLPRSKSSFMASANNNSGGGPDVHAITEDYQRKVQENQSLHNKIFDLEQSFMQQIGALNEKLVKCVHENEQLRSRVQQNGTIHEPLGTDLDDSMITSEDLLVPSIDTEELWSEYHRLIKLFSISMGNYLKYSKDRAKLYPADATMQDISTVNQNYCDSISACEDQWAVVSRFMLKFDNHNDMCLDEIRVSLKYLADELTLFADLARTKLVPDFTNSVMEECSAQWCTETLVTHNSKWSTSVCMLFQSAIPKFATSFGLLINGNHNDGQLAIIRDNIEDMVNSWKALHESFDAKLTVEQRLPVATKKLRAVNECLRACATAAYKQMADISNLYNQAESSLTEFINNWKGVQNDQIDPSNPFFASDNEETDLNKSTQTHNNSDTEQSYNDQHKDIDQYKQQLLQSNSTVNEQTVLIEQLRNQLAIAIARHHKLAGSGDSGTSLKQQAESENESSSKSIIESPGAVYIDKDKADDENYYLQRVQQLVQEQRHINAQRTYLLTEAEELSTQILLMEQENSKVSEEHANCDIVQQQIKDELESTRQSYEDQLASLSEHLAQLNQQLTDKSDQLDNVKGKRSNTVQHGDKKSTNLASLFSKH